MLRKNGDVFFSVLAAVLTLVLLVFFIAMWLRFGFDWVRLLAPRWRPKGLLLVIAEGSYIVTDPPIKLVRRVIPPLRLGGAVLDFAWSVVLLLCIVAFSLLGSLGSLG